MPKTLEIDFDDAESARRHILALKTLLTSGEAVVFPTDTFYGLGVDPFNADAVARLFAIKGRPADKPVLVLVADEAQLHRLARSIPPAARRLMTALWPGPLTLLFPARPELPAGLTAGTGTIGLRLPGNPFTRRLLAELGTPLTAPSANRSGGREPSTAEDAALDLGDALAAVIDHGPAPGGAPSTVLDTTVSPPRIVRAGALTRARIEAALGGPCAPPERPSFPS